MSHIAFARPVLAATILAAAAALAPSPAQARVCDPNFRPLCVSPCVSSLPGRASTGAQNAAHAASNGDVKGAAGAVTGIIFVMCPA